MKKRGFRYAEPLFLCIIITIRLPVSSESQVLWEDGASLIAIAPSFSRILRGGVQDNYRPSLGHLAEFTVYNIQCQSIGTTNKTTARQIDVIVYTRYVGVAVGVGIGG